MVVSIFVEIIYRFHVYNARLHLVPKPTTKITVKFFFPKIGHFGLSSYFHGFKLTAESFIVSHKHMFENYSNNYATFFTVYTCIELDVLLRSKKTN